MTSLTLTDYRIRLIGVSEILHPHATEIEVGLHFLEGDEANLESSIVLTLQMPRNDDTTLATLRASVRAALPELLYQAARLSEAFLPEDGTELSRQRLGPLPEGPAK